MSRAPGKPPAFRLTPVVQKEHPLQLEIARVLQLEIAPPGELSEAGVVWWAVDHASYHGEVPGARMARGVVAGLPDNWFAWEGRCGVVELKSPTGGVLSDAQRIRLPILRQAGLLIAVCNDTWQLLRVLDYWGVPRCHRIRVSA